MMVGLGGQRGRWFVVEVVVVGGLKEKTKGIGERKRGVPFILGSSKLYI